MVVGDDWQAIYSFRAATLRNILRFAKQYRPKRGSSNSDRIIARRNQFSMLATLSSLLPVRVM
jgi:superfamily I DNA/RNA helicase